MAGAPFRVFYSYSHSDSRMVERLRTHMAMLRREGLITEWYDREIEAGSKWRDEIERELEAADVILLLVSAAFLASDFCYEKEMIRAVERARRGEALVIGVMLRPVDGWDGTPFAGFQVVPRDARPISKWSNADEAYADVVERIRAALEERAVAASRQRPRARRSLTHGSPRAAESADTARRSDTAKGGDEVLSPFDRAILDAIDDPEQRELERRKIMLSQAMRNPDTRAEALRAIRQNFRA